MRGCPKSTRFLAEPLGDLVVAPRRIMAVTRRIWPLGHDHTREHCAGADPSEGGVFDPFGPDKSLDARPARVSAMRGRHPRLVALAEFLGFRHPADIGQTLAQPTSALMERLPAG